MVWAGSPVVRGGVGSRWLLGRFGGDASGPGVAGLGRVLEVAGRPGRQGDGGGDRDRRLSGGGRERSDTQRRGRPWVSASAAWRCSPSGLVASTSSTVARKPSTPGPVSSSFTPMR